MSPLDDIEIKEVEYTPIDEVAMLKSEISYLKGKIKVYEDFLKFKGYIEDEE